MSHPTKKILTIVVIAILIIGALLLLWAWYTNKQQGAASEQNTSRGNGSTNTSVGTNKNPTTGYGAQVQPTSSSGNGSFSKNGASSQGQTSTYNSGNYIPPGQTGTNGSSADTVAVGTYGNGSAGSESLGTVGSTGGSGTGGGGTGNTQPPGPSTPTGAEWNPLPGNPFTPTNINGINGSNPTGTGGNLLIQQGSGSSGGTGGTSKGLSTLLAGAGAVSACIPGLFPSATQLISGAVSNAVSGAAGKALGNATGNSAANTAIQNAGLDLGSLGIDTFQSIAVKDTVTEQNTGKILQNARSESTRTNFLDCISRQLARAALQRITASTVDWINSGFHGSPTFIQNYQQFFSNVANDAAGAYLQGSSLAFLCSPFSLQVKIAVAQAYANSNSSSRSGAGAACTLQQASNNINNFINGNFSAGGWPALISFTTVPTNNPFGAYMYAKAGLQSSVANAQQNAAKNISADGFINMQQVTCPNTTSNTRVTVSSKAGVACPVDCTCKTTTPGSVIAGTLTKQLNLPSDELNMAKNFDEVISALMTQLLTKALQGGVSNLSGQSGYASSFLTANQQQGAVAAQSFLQQLQSDTTVAQQYGYAKQGAIADIQNTQAQLQSVNNCWSSAASSTVFTNDKQAQAASNAAADQTQITVLQNKVDAYNNDITRANNAIAVLEQLQTQVLNASSNSQVQTLQTQYASDIANGLVLTTSDLTTAQQDRTTLQAQMNSINQDAGAQLTSCYAFGK
ncbi:MAG: hypothetical protein M3N30_01320 [Bacteroidota bacterium]|nr:hypothetical protein [Bacteroidota bacterium]